MAVTSRHEAAGGRGEGEGEDCRHCLSGVGFSSNSQPVCSAQRTRRVQTEGMPVGPEMRHMAYIFSGLTSAVH